MIPEVYPFWLKDLFHEVYWVDGWFDESIKPPITNGTVFKWEALITDPLPMVDLIGHQGRQRFYSNEGTRLNRLAYDSNFVALSAPKSKFLGYEHRLPITMRKAIFGYSTWDQLKILVQDAEVLSNAVIGFRNRPGPSAERDQYGNAYLGSSTYRTSSMGEGLVTGIKWSFLGHYDRNNIPCGRGLFIYRTVTNGLVSESVNQFCDPISAIFMKYTVSVHGEVTVTQQTLYYHPSDNLWKDAVNGNAVSGYFEHEDILLGSHSSSNPADNFVFEISAGNITSNIFYLPIEVSIRVLLATGEWLDGIKRKTVSANGNFQGIGYSIGGILISEPFLEAIYINGGYRHETSVNYTQWGGNAQFWNANGGLKTTVSAIERDIPYIG